MAVSRKYSTKFNLRENNAQPVYWEAFRGKRRAYWDKHRVSHYHLTLPNLYTFLLSNAAVLNCHRSSYTPVNLFLAIGSAELSKSWRRIRRIRKCYQNLLIFLWILYCCEQATFSRVFY